MTDPSLLNQPSPIPTEAENADSANLPAMTIIGPDVDTVSYICRLVNVQDPAGTERYLLFVGDLSGDLYVYDIADVFQTMATSTVPPQGKHYGWFFNDPPVATYHTQQSLSDTHTQGVFGMDVVHENWDPGTGPMEATYIYLGVNRFGIEVLKLGWVDVNPSGPPDWKPDLPGIDPTKNYGYIGRIQTPGDPESVYIRSVNGEPHLFEADYGGGIRVFKHPTPGQ